MTKVTVGGIEFTLEWRGRVVEKPDSIPGWGYLSYPSVMLDDDNRYKMWFASWPHDFIYYAESATPFGTYQWNKDEQAITPGPCDAEVPRAGPFPPTCSYLVKRYKTSEFGDPNIWPCPPTTQSALTDRDSFLTANPCVLKLDFGGGVFRYHMWYTGTSNALGKYGAIFFAHSEDGKIWMKQYQQVTNPNGTIGKCGPLIQAQDPSAIDSGVGYCAGEASMIQLPDAFYLYYTDTTVNPAARLLRMPGSTTIASWPSKAVLGLGNYTRWNVRYHAPTDRMIAFCSANGDGVRISVSEKLSSDPDAACQFFGPVTVSIAGLGIPFEGGLATTIKEGGLLADRTGWITDMNTAYFFGYGADDGNTWTIGALEVTLSIVG
jgi:hypothetical protein